MGSDRATSDLSPDEDEPVRVLLVDDEPAILRAYVRTLQKSGCAVETAASGEKAIQLIEAQRFDVVVSDISMPGISGVDLLRAVRARDLDIPVVLVTGEPTVESAIEAVQFGALRYLTKPVDVVELEAVIRRAAQMARVSRMEREAVSLIGVAGKLDVDRAGLEAGFQRALERMWMAFQPIVSLSRREVFAYEALLRTDEPSLGNPMLFVDAAERLGQVHQLGRAVRARVASDMASSPADCTLFVNLHPLELLDDDLVSRAAPLSRFAERVVLEVTERHTLAEMTDLGARVARIRALGYRLAVDDLGAGYAGLSSFAQLAPQVVKLDMSLVRDLHREPTKRKLISHMVALCRDLEMEVISEGVETADERDALAGLGCDLLQGYLFARPGRPFPAPAF